MRLEVKLPELGDSEATEATVSFWYFDPGERVGEGEDMVELLTDKAAFNVPAPASGTLVQIATEEGRTVKVGEVLAYIETEGQA
jgi:2-oxoglutarate dehydrogenase E2 component (dihydrolipoamide succinyltransferase)